MSASTMPTLSPCLAIARARLTVTEDLPTPPLPLAIARPGDEPAWANGTLLRLAAAEDLLRPALPGHHAQRQVHDVTPGPSTAAVTSGRWCPERTAGDGEQHVTETLPASPTHGVDHVEPAIDADLVSLTVASAAWICSRNGAS
jgi:hypothetical protein